MSVRRKKARRVHEIVELTDDDDDMVEPNIQVFSTSDGGQSIEIDDHSSDSSDLEDFAGVEKVPTYGDLQRQSKTTLVKKKQDVNAKSSKSRTPSNTFSQTRYPLNTLGSKPGVSSQHNLANGHRSRPSNSSTLTNIPFGTKPRKCSPVKTAVIAISSDSSDDNEPNPKRKDVKKTSSDLPPASHSRNTSSANKYFPQHGDSTDDFEVVTGSQKPKLGNADGRRFQKANCMTSDSDTSDAALAHENCPIDFSKNILAESDGTSGKDSKADGDWNYIRKLTSKEIKDIVPGFDFSEGSSPILPETPQRKSVTTQKLDKKVEKCTTSEDSSDSWKPRTFSHNKIVHSQEDVVVCETDEEETQDPNAESDCDTIVNDEHPNSSQQSHRKTKRRKSADKYNLHGLWPPNDSEGDTDDEQTPTNNLPLPTLVSADGVSDGSSSDGEWLIKPSQVSKAYPGISRRPPSSGSSRMSTEKFQNASTSKPHTYGKKQTPRQLPINQSNGRTKDTSARVTTSQRAGTQWKLSPECQAITPNHEGIFSMVKKLNQTSPKKPIVQRVVRKQSSDSTSSDDCLIQEKSPPKLCEKFSGHSKASHTIAKPLAVLPVHYDPYSFSQDSEKSDPSVHMSKESRLCKRRAHSPIFGNSKRNKSGPLEETTPQPNSTEDALDPATLLLDNKDSSKTMSQNKQSTQESSREKSTVLPFTGKAAGPNISASDLTQEDKDTRDPGLPFIEEDIAVTKPISTLKPGRNVESASDVDKSGDNNKENDNDFTFTQQVDVFVIDSDEEGAEDSFAALSQSFVQTASRDEEDEQDKDDDDLSDIIFLDPWKMDFNASVIKEEPDNENALTKEKNNENAEKEKDEEANLSESLYLTQKAVQEVMNNWSDDDYLPDLDGTLTQMVQGGDNDAWGDCDDDLFLSLDIESTSTKPPCAPKPEKVEEASEFVTASAFDETTVTQQVEPDLTKLEAEVKYKRINFDDSNQVVKMRKTSFSNADEDKDSKPIGEKQTMSTEQRLSIQEQHAMEELTPDMLTQLLDESMEMDSQMVISDEENEQPIIKPQLTESFHLNTVEKERNVPSNAEFVYAEKPGDETPKEIQTARGPQARTVAQDAEAQQMLISKMPNSSETVPKTIELPKACAKAAIPLKDALNEVVTSREKGVEGFTSVDYAEDLTDEQVQAYLSAKYASPSPERLPATEDPRGKEHQPIIISDEDKSPVKNLTLPVSISLSDLKDVDKSSQQSKSADQTVQNVQGKTATAAALETALEMAKQKLRESRAQKGATHEPVKADDYGSEVDKGIAHDVLSVASSAKIYTEKEPVCPIQKSKVSAHSHKPVDSATKSSEPTAKKRRVNLPVAAPCPSTVPGSYPPIQQSLPQSNMRQRTDEPRSCSSFSHRHEDSTTKKDESSSSSKDKVSSSHSDRISPTHKDKTSSHSHKDKTSSHSHKDKTSSRSHKEKTSSRSHKEKTSSHSHKEKTSSHSHKDKTGSHSHKDKTSSHSHKDKTSSHSHKDKTSSHSHKEKTSSHSHKEKSSSHSHKDTSGSHSRKDKASSDSSKDKSSYDSSKDKKGSHSSRDKSHATSSRSSSTSHNSSHKDRTSTHSRIDTSSSCSRSTSLSPNKSSTSTKTKENEKSKDPISKDCNVSGSWSYHEKQKPGAHSSLKEQKPSEDTKSKEKDQMASKSGHQKNKQKSASRSKSVSPKPKTSSAAKVQPPSKSLADTKTTQNVSKRDSSTDDEEDGAWISTKPTRIAHSSGTKSSVGAKAPSTSDSKVSSSAVSKFQARLRGTNIPEKPAKRSRAKSKPQRTTPMYDDNLITMTQSIENAKSNMYERMRQAKEERKKQQNSKTTDPFSKEKSTTDAKKSTSKDHASAKPSSLYKTSTDSSRLPSSSKEDTKNPSVSSITKRAEAAKKKNETVEKAIADITESMHNLSQSFRMHRDSSNPDAKLTNDNQSKTTSYTSESSKSSEMLSKTVGGAGKPVDDATASGEPTAKKKRIVLPVAAPCTSTVPGSYQPKQQLDPYELLKSMPALTIGDSGKNLCTEDFLNIVLQWIPQWLDEMFAFEGHSGGKTLPPVMNPATSGPHAILKSDTLWPVPDTFENVKEYSEIMLGHILYELWAATYSEWRANRTRPNMMSVIPLSKDASDSGFHTLIFQGLVNRNQQVPISEGDLVIVHMKVFRRDRGHTETQRVFGYVNRTDKFEPRNQGQLHPKLGDIRHVKNARKSLVQASVRFFHRIPFGTDFMDLQTVTSLISVLRQITALIAFARNPLSNDLIQPVRHKTFLPIQGREDKNLQKLFNTSQVKVIDSVVASLLQPFVVPRVSLVQGPPGTGKSHTILAIIRSTIFRKTADGRVPCLMLCAPSNAAIDELVRRIAIENDIRKKNGDELVKVVRMGNPSTMSETSLKYSLDTKVKEAWENRKLLEKLQTMPQSIRKEILQVHEQLPRLREQLAMAQQSKAPLDQLKKLEADIKMLEKKEAKFKDVGKRNEPTPKERNQLRYEVLAHAHIVACTLNSAGSRIISDAISWGQSQALNPNYKGPRFQFTGVLIDEACQCVEVEALIPLQYCSTKLVLIGDPHQLPPTVISQEAETMKFSQSLFERLYNYFRMNSVDAVFLLDTQYRMHPQISAFPSQHVYDGRLKTDPGLAGKRALFPFRHYFVFDLVYSKEESDQRSLSVYNPAEVEFVMSLVKFLAEVTGRVKPHLIGVITPYKKQKLMLQDQLRNCNLQQVTVGTVDGFQGQEKDVIIVSCVRACSANNKIGFVADKRRMNVALTRAKYGCYVVGHLKSLKVDEDWGALIKDAIGRNLVASVKNSASREGLIPRVCIKPPPKQQPKR